MLGAEVRVQLLFWVSCVLVGVVYYQYPKVREQIGGLAAFFSWLAAALVSLLMHETGHLLAARLFGVRPRVVLSGLGGRLFGLETLKRWQVLLVLAAGPLMSFLLYGVFWLVTDPSVGERLPLPRDWRVFLGPSLWLLMWINIFWCLLNVLPLWPLDGGRFAVEIGEALLGRRGRTLALLLSLVVTLLLIVFVAVWIRVSLINRFDPRYLIYFVYSCIMSLYCYAFWLSTFRALWGDSEKTEVTTHERVDI
jgi:membrane-associated protease RseP (regulator of RpoE activity)